MKPCISLVLALCTALVSAAAPAKTVETAQVPHTAAAKAAAGLISRAEHAIVGYVAACVSNAAQDLNGVMTEDARIEFALDEPGTYLSIDASSWAAGCAANVRSGDSPRMSNLWIFPTLDADVVFVQYDVPAPAGAVLERQLVLLEMRGERIARMVNFTSASTASVTRAASASLAR